MVPPTNPAVLTPSGEAAPVLLLLAVAVAVVVLVELTELIEGLVELLLVSM